MTHQSQLEKPKYRNWIRAGLGLLYVKEGLEPFCDDTVQQQHTDIINKVQQTQSLATVTCGQCNLRTLKPNHVRDQHRQCPLRQVNCNCQYPGGKNPCPNNVCGVIYDEIINLHAATPPAPCWKNTDSQHWCTDPWSIARCFINAPGYADKLSVSDTDCSGILHVIINNRGLHSHIQCPITGTDIFSEVRKYRNSVFHSSSMELEDSDVTSILDNMIAVLQDGKELNNRAEAQAAVQKLTQLKNEDFIITTKTEAQVLEAAVNALIEKGNKITNKMEDAKVHLESKQNEISDILTQMEMEIKRKSDKVCGTLDKKEAEIEKKLQQHTKASDDLHQKFVDLEQKLSELKIEIERKMNDPLDEIQTESSSSNVEINESVASIRKIDKTTKEDLQKVFDEIEHISKKVDILEADMGEQKKQINEEFSNLRIELKENNEKKLSRQDQLNYIKKKEDFQTRLMELYNGTVVKVPALPLQPRGKREDIGTVYFKPWLEMETTKTQISMHEIFSSNDERVNLIYLLGEAGTGKSVFCKYLVRQWCNAHAVENESDFETVNMLKTFEFLFYITLRHSIGCDDIRSMLHQQYGDPILDRILENESCKCLILLDGLDEWTQNKQISQFQSKGLPTRDLSKQYTILTTSRPWKFETLHVRDEEVQKRVILKGVNTRPLHEMETKFIDMLNHRFQKNKKHEEFKKQLAQSPVSELSHVPIILQQLICLWFDDKLHGTSISATYSSMLELFFDWAELKTLDGDELAKVRDLAQNQNVQLPEYLYSSDTCNKFKYIISSLSRLAFETLFSDNKENSLSFPSSTFQHLKIPINVKECFLKTGILTEDRCVTLNASSRQKSSFSFSHKTFQEYLAAVYIAIQFETLSEIRVKDKCKQCFKKYFAGCKTLDEILDKSNVFIMLCGLKSQLITNICENISKIVTSAHFDDELETMATHYYWTTHIMLRRETYRRYVTSVQKRVSRCAEEVATTGKQLQQSIHLAKIFVKDGFNLSSVCEQAIILESVRTLHSDSGKFIKLLPQMTHLTTLDIAKTKLSGEDCTALIAFLTQSIQLENIFVSFDCRDHQEHRLDLSKHDKIECIEYAVSGFCVYNSRTDYLHGAKIVIQYREYKAKCIHLNKHSLQCQYLIESETRTYSLLMLLPPVPSLSNLCIVRSTLIGPVFAHPSNMKSLRTIEFVVTSMSMTTWRNFIDSLPALPNAVEVKTYALHITNDGEDSMGSNMIDNSQVKDEKDDSLDKETNDDVIVEEVKDDSTDDNVSYDSSNDELNYTFTECQPTDDSAAIAEAKSNYIEAMQYVIEKAELFRIIHADDFVFDFITNGVVNV